MLEAATELHAEITAQNTPTSPTGSSSKPRRNQPSSYSAASGILGSITKKARIAAAQNAFRTSVTAPPAHSP